MSFERWMILSFLFLTTMHDGFCSLHLLASDSVSFYSRCAHFDASIDLLVKDFFHDMEENKERQSLSCDHRSHSVHANPSPVAPLAHVVVLLRTHLPHFASLLVRCARHQDMSMWSFFFKAVGSPLQLQEDCLKENHLAAACWLLPIMRVVEPESFSLENSLHLLTLVIKTKSWDLCEELLRYVRAWEHQHVLSNTNQQERNDSMSESLTLLDKESDMSRPPTETTFNSPYSTMEPSLLIARIESLLSSTARQFLKKYQWKSFVDLTLIHSDHVFPWALGDWLKHQRTDSPWINDIEEALLMVHADFEIPLPENEHTDMLIKEKGELLMMSPSYQLTQESPPEMVLMHLAMLMDQAAMYEVAAVLYLFLQKESALLDVIYRSKEDALFYANVPNFLFDLHHALMECSPLVVYRDLYKNSLLPKLEPFLK